MTFTLNIPKRSKTTDPEPPRWTHADHVLEDARRGAERVTEAIKRFRGQYVPSDGATWTGAR